MKTTKLILTALLSGTMLLGGCIDLSSDDTKAAIEEAKKTFSEEFDEFEDEDNQQTSASEARDEDYLGTTDVDVADTTGSSRVAGEVALSQLSSDDNTQGNSLRRSMQSRAVDQPDATNFAVSFINGTGTITTLAAGTYTVRVNPTLTTAGDLQYIIEGLGDGVNYIIEVVVTVDDAPINLKSVAFIPEGAEKSEKAVIDPVSTVVAQVVEAKVVSGFFSTGGDKFSPQYINDLNETMTVIVVELIDNTDGDNASITLASFEAAIASGSAVDNLVSKLLSNDDVSTGLDTLEDVAIDEQFEAPDVTDDNVDLAAPVGDVDDVDYDPDLTLARDYIANLFSELFGDNKDGAPSEGGGGAPQLFIDFFGDQFEARTQKTVGEVFGALEDGLSDPSGVSPFGTAEKTTALADFKDTFSFIYAVLDQVDNETASVVSSDDPADADADGSRSLAEARDFLENEIPPTLLAVFPPGTDLAAFAMGTVLEVPQALTMIFFVLEEFEGDDNEGGEGGEGGDDGFDPFELLKLYGFNPDNAEHLADYGGIEINWLGIHPGSMYIDGTGEIDILNAFTCVDNFLGGDTFEVTGVTLTYPTKAGGTETKDLVDESTYHDNGGDGGGSCWVWDTWQEQLLLEQDDTFSQTEDEFGQGLDWNAITQHLLDNNKIISDFASGDYIVTVNYTDADGSGTETRTFRKNIITGLQQLNPRLTTPNSFPRPPEGNVSEAEWTAFFDEQGDFVPTVFPVGAIGTFAWEEPEGLAAVLATINAEETVVVAAYSLEIGRNDCSDSSGGDQMGDDQMGDDQMGDDQMGDDQMGDDQMGGDQMNGGYCEWNPIFSTWQDNTQIFDTQFELPGDVKDQLVELGLDEQQYQVHLGISFINVQTGEYLGQGGHSNAEFRVGTAIEDTDTFTVNGVVANVPTDDVTMDDGTAYPLSAYKVALIEGNCSETTCTETILVSSAITETSAGNGTYSLTPTFGQANVSGGSWIEIRMFIDANDNGVLDHGDGATQGDIMFWSHSNVWINSWGGVLRIASDNCNADFTICDYKEEAIVPEGEYNGPDFDTAPKEFDGATDTPQ